MRTKITLACTECKQRNYNMTKDKKTHPDRMETRSTADSARDIRCTKKLSNPVCKKDVNLWEKRQVMRKPLKRTLSKA